MPSATPQGARRRDALRSRTGDPETRLLSFDPYSLDSGQANMFTWALRSHGCDAAGIHPAFPCIRSRARASDTDPDSLEAGIDAHG